MVSGTYLIINKETGQKYIGGSIDIDYRMYLHEHSPNDCSYIDIAIKKYGFDNFKWITLEELPADWGIIGESEKYWIEFYNTFKNKKHYNLTEGGEGISGYRKKYEDFEYTVAKKGFVNGKQRYCIYNRKQISVKSGLNKNKLFEICYLLNNKKITEKEARKYDVFEYTISKNGNNRFKIADRNNRALKTCADPKKLKIICDALNNNKITEYDVKSIRGVNKIIEMIK